MPPADNTRFLAEASKQRHQQARERAEAAIEAASRRSGRPTVEAVAAAASVSRSWLYTQPDLIAALTQLRDNRPAGTAPARGTRTSDASLRRRLEAALAKNKELRGEVSDLTRRLEAAHGEIRRLRVPGGRPERTSHLANSSEGHARDTPARK